MKYRSKKEVVYKDQITHLLLLLLEIAGTDVQNSKNFEDDYKKRLKFQEQTDWKRFRASIDLLDDTEEAIISAFKYQLGDLSRKYKDSGELYLRLYGILNAVYLQMGAYEEIALLIHFSNRNSIKELFQKLDIYKLRGIAGAHTIDYWHDEETIKSQPNINKKTSFRIVQFYLEETGKSITVLDENNIQFEFNLLEILIEYEKIATDLLVKLIHFSVENLVHKKDDKIDLKSRLYKLLPNLIIYSTLNKNEAYLKRVEKRNKKKRMELINNYYKEEQL